MSAVRHRRIPARVDEWYDFLAVYQLDDVKSAPRDDVHTVAAVVFVVIEIFAPGAVFIWLGFGATVVGGVKFFQPDLSLEYQLLIFAVMSVVSAFGWRAYRRKSPAPETDQPALNRRGSQYVGRTFTLSEPIVNGQGNLED